MMRTGVSPRRALWVVVALAALVLVYENRHLWFGGDDWFILTDRTVLPHAGRLGIFEAHNEHWSTLPILAFRGLYAVIGLTTYWPYIALAIVAHLALVVLLWHVMVRAAIDEWVATCACAVFAVLGIGFENITNAWQVTLIAPLALGLAALLVSPERGPFSRRDAIAAALMTAAMMCSGTALPLLVVVAVVLFVGRGWRVAAATVAAPALAYGAWYLGYGRNAAEVADPAPRAIPRFVWHGLTDALGDTARLRALGVVAVVALVAWLVCKLTRRPWDPKLLTPVALAFGGVLFLASTGLRRGNLFGADPATSRYAYTTVAFVLPLVVLGGQRLLCGDAPRRLVLVAITAALLIAQVRVLDHAVDIAEPGKRSDRGAVLATALLAREGRPFLLASPLYAFEPQMTVPKIVAIDRDGKLPSLDAVDERDRLTVLGRLSLFVGPESLLPPGANAAVILGKVAHGARTAASGASDCASITARAGNEAIFRTRGPSTLQVEGDGTIALHLRDPKTGVDGETVYFTLPRHDEQALSIGVIDGDLVASFPAGENKVCGVTG